MAGAGQGEINTTVLVFSTGNAAKPCWWEQTQQRHCCLGCSAPKGLNAF